MRNYEMMTILSPDLETEAQESSVNKIEKLISKNSGKVDSVDRWGKKRLAYEINHFKEGIYSIFYFSGQPESIKEIGRVMKIDDDVLRFIIVRKPEKP